MIFPFNALAPMQAARDGPCNMITQADASLRKAVLSLREEGRAVLRLGSGSSAFALALRLAARQQAAHELPDCIAPSSRRKAQFGDIKNLSFL
jgi:hypothetical protein